MLCKYKIIKRSFYIFFVSVGLIESKGLVAFQPDVLPIELKWDRAVNQGNFENYQECPPVPRSLFQLHRFIERQYQNLPWPSELKQIAIMTEVKGGRGDISAGAKVINMMQKMCPSLSFDWIVLPRQHNPQSFLTYSDLSKIKIRTPSLVPEEPVHADFLVVGPVAGAGTAYIQRKFEISLKGPRLDFLENAYPVESEALAYVASETAREGSQGDIHELYRKIHSLFFPAQTRSSNGISMGLQQGSGVFLDESRMHAPLSQDYYCPSYLQELEDQELQRDILMALDINKENTLLSCEKNSFNSGYAHRPTSWAKFIDFVAIHERNKNVTVVLNQWGEFAALDTQGFSNEILTLERLDFLKKWGYGTVIIKGSESDPLVVRESSSLNERKLTIILRPSFKPNDMKWLQLASERILATGDNTAAEAWAARCKLYVYEDVANHGCKNAFLKQQVELANTISLNLGTLLQTFGRNNPPLSTEEMDQMIAILQNPSLSKDTLQFCNLITQNYSFGKILEGALKRTAWLHCMPELIDEEVDSMDEEFKLGLIDFLKSADSPPQVINIKNLPMLAERIQLKVQEYLKN
jgi:hypothetical protein